MTLNPALGKLKYNFQKFDFENDGSIKFPKVGNDNQFGRDNCFELAVDIIIVSTTQEQYRNFKSTPAHGFFGYASIVTQDCLLEPIPLKFARQRIYEEKVVEAYQCWQDLAVYLGNTKKWFELLESVITKGEAVNPPPKNICEIETYRARWNELSIREVYVELPRDSAFRIEISWISPESFVDSCGNTQDGKSKKPDDPKKDAGLPPSGIQPKINPRSNPFGGNAPSNGSSQNPSGLINDPRFNNFRDNTDDTDDDNSDPSPAPIQFGIKLIWTQSCRPSGQPEEVTRKFQGDIIDSDLVIFTIAAGVAPCFQDRALVATNNRTGAIYGVDGLGVIYSVGGAPPAIFYIPLPSPEFP